MHCSAYNSHVSTLLGQYSLRFRTTASDLSVDLKTSGRVPAQVGIDFSGNCVSESSVTVI